MRLLKHPQSSSHNRFAPGPRQAGRAVAGRLRRLTSSGATDLVEVFASNDPVRISYAEALLTEARIEFVTLDGQTASVFGGALPWIRRRVMVANEDGAPARRLLNDAFAGDEEA